MTTVVKETVYYVVYDDGSKWGPFYNKGFAEGIASQNMRDKPGLKATVEPSEKRIK